MKRTILLLISFIVVSINMLQAQSTSWNAIAPAKFPTNVSGQIHGISRVSQMKFHPTNSLKMYAISARGGLFITSDGGNNWSVAPGTDFMPYQRLASVCVDFTNDQIIYLGTGDHDYYYNGTGVWKSINGGQTFTQTSLNSVMIVEMIMDPNNHNIIVAATNAGIYKTIDGGSTWTLKSVSRSFDDLQRKAATNSRTLFASTTDTAFYRSNDFGDTWTQINSGIILPSGITTGGGCRIAVTPADSNVVYLGMVGSGGMIYKSTNGGTSFSIVKTSGTPYTTYYTNLSTDVGQGDYNFAIGADRVNANILYIVAHCVWKSTDGGATWTQLTNWWEKVHTDMHQIITSPYNNNQLWNMNDGGVWLSTDAGVSWTPKSDGMFGYEIYHGNCSPTRKDMISIGTQDNGELYSTSSGWFTNRGGDWGNNCVFDYRPSSTMVYYLNTKNRRTVIGSDATYGFPGGNVTNLAFNRTNIDLGFACDSNVYRTTNLSAGTPSWTKIYTLNKKVMAVHSSMADSNRLYVITNDSKIYVSTNALSVTPTFTMYSLPNSTNSLANITSIKSNSSVLYITCNTKVYRSANNGSTWTDITYNLPSVNHIGIVSDEYFSSNEIVFIGSNNSVYYKRSADVSWTIYNTSLPSRPTLNDLSIYNDGTANTALRVSVYGRGMWEAPLNSLRPLTVAFTVDRSNLCPDTIAHFSDISTGNVTSRLWTFTGGTPSTSTAQNPSVSYHNVGTYPVSLSVSDGTNNASLTQSNYISTQGLSLPFVEGFEGSFPPSRWTLIDDGNDGQVWTQANGVGGYGNSSNSLLYDNYDINTPGKKDEIRSSAINIAGYSSAYLLFDIAYAFYGASYSDSLVVKISTDCGNSFTRVYYKGGSNLSTVSSTNYFTPLASNWRTDSISLNSFIGNSVIISFQNINDYGNTLYIDNIRINGLVTANAGTDKTICKGTTVQLGSSSVNGLSYSWSPTTGLSSSSVSNPIDSASTTTTYILTATHSQSGISNKDTVLVTVSPLPDYANLITGPIFVDKNQSNLNYSVPQINNASSYIWTIPTGFTGTSTTNIIVLNAGNNAANGSITVKGHNTCGDGSIRSFDIKVTKKLVVKLWLEALYNQSISSMNKVQDEVGDHFGGDTTDIITIGIAQKNFPYNITDTCTSGLRTNGFISALIRATAIDSNYIVVRHRNSVETWSAKPVSFLSDSINYDFTTSYSKTMGDNTNKLMTGVYAIYTGDVNQDGIINIYDLSDVFDYLNDPYAIIGYVIEDLNGDGAVNIYDLSTVFDNLNNGIGSINPLNYLKKK